jgi:AcrR family transcriptional regulator
VAKRDTSGSESESGHSRLPRGRHGLPPEVVAENQRERLVAGIIEAVGEDGYGATTIGAIVKAAGLSRKTFYQHFANKEECFKAAYEATFGYLLAAIEAVDPEKGWGETVRARLRRLLEILTAEPELASFFLVSPTSVGDEIAERHHEAMRELVGALTAGAPKRGEKSAPVGSREQALAGGISRLIVRKLGEGEAAALPELSPALTELVLWPYLGGEEAVRIAGQPSRRRGGSRA